MKIECEVVEMKEGKPVKVEYEGVIFIKEEKEIPEEKEEEEYIDDEPKQRRGGLNFGQNRGIPKFKNPYNFRRKP